MARNEVANKPLCGGTAAESHVCGVMTAFPQRVIHNFKPFPLTSRQSALAEQMFSPGVRLMYGVSTGSGSDRVVFTLEETYAGIERRSNCFPAPGIVLPGRYRSRY